jgi:hypothetical protein
MRSRCRVAHISRLVRGCHAASRDREGRPDESVRRAWRARPEPGTERTYVFTPCRIPLAESLVESQLRGGGNYTVVTGHDLTKEGDHASSGRVYQTIADRRLFHDYHHLQLAHEKHSRVVRCISTDRAKVRGRARSGGAAAERVLRVGDHLARAPGSSVPAR